MMGETEFRVQRDITLARRFLQEGHYDGIEMAVFTMRNAEVTATVGLKDLAWAMYQGGTSRHEVEWLIDEVERRYTEQREE